MPKLMKERDELPPGFTTPTALPSSDAEREVWQAANRQWWEGHPMRYDWNDGIAFKEFSKEFFADIDQRFFSLVELYAPCKRFHSTGSSTSIRFATRTSSRLVLATAVTLNCLRRVRAPSPEST